MEGLNEDRVEILPYPLQRGLVRNLSIAAEAAGRSDLMQLWAGQSAGLSNCTDVSDFLKSLIQEVSEIGAPVMQWSTKQRNKKLSTATENS
jgi:nitronate monooxygenase